MKDSTERENSLNNKYFAWEMFVVMFCKRWP